MNSQHNSYWNKYILIVDNYKLICTYKSAEMGRYRSSSISQYGYCLSKKQDCDSFPSLIYHFIVHWANNITNLTQREINHLKTAEIM